MRILPLLLLVLASLSCFGQNTSALPDKKTTREQLDIKGNFGPELKNGLPEGWIPPVGLNFDDAGKISLIKISGTEKNALHVTAQTKAMRFTFDKKWPVASGDKCVISAIVRGNGGVDLGAYYFPRTNLLPAPIKGFLANEQWTEFTTEIPVPKINPEINEIVIVMGASFGASVEFAEVRAEIIKKEEPKSTGVAINVPGNTLSVSDRLWKIANVREAFLIDRQVDENIRHFLALKQQAKKMLEGNDLSGASELIRKYDKQVEEVREPAKRIVVGIQNRHAIPQLYVNGKEVQVTSGKYVASIKEGLNIIGLKVKVNGQTPGLRISIPGQPELESRWRVGTVADESWLTTAFDDRAWKKAELDKDGYLLVPEGFAGTVCFRQIVLWGDNHYSGLPCIQPKVREWGFSEKSMETLFHVLYSPLKFALDDYEFVLDLPQGFSLLRQKYEDGFDSGKFNRRPKKVTEETVKHGGQYYTRYRIAFDPDFVQAGETSQGTLIPILLNGHKGPDKLCKFYFRRVASGNLTELEQTLPVRILPPINGRMPKTVMLGQYASVPWAAKYSISKLFPEHLEAHMRQSLDAGFNSWTINTNDGVYGKKVYERVLERGGAVVLQPGGNYPHLGIFTGNLALKQLMLAVPEFRARLFNQAERVKEPGQFCRSYITGEGSARFREALKKDIGAMLHGDPELKFVGFPKATFLWINYEQKIWNRDPAKRFCFCDNCKKAFRQYAKLPDTMDLSDESIFKNYNGEWKAFREELEGSLNGMVRDVSKELGLKYMLYDDVFNDGYWSASKGKIDMAFPGWPGDGTAIGTRTADITRHFPVTQQSLDERMTFFRDKVGQPKVEGQLCASVFNIIEKPGVNWIQNTGSTIDGFINAKSMKSQILRVMTAFHGGVDLGSAMNRCAGQLYYIGEATRIIAEYEGLFYDGKREDSLALSEQLNYPNLLVLTKGDERLVLLFNETDKPMTVKLSNKNLKSGQSASVFESSTKISNPEMMSVEIGAGDVTVVDIR